MLKALELIGFKSFADKTRFEFPPGVTVIVGPNGSGKSNVVDAMKWVLGSQSVKALRGKEMTDVIFNGSGSRRAVNTAEVTLTFDNAKGLLSVNTPEVQITRRVYRSGEGEYFINKKPCRLKDIKTLFAGTGIATEAYSVIEQGKVDVMLQSSPRDRRVIFEEAAGISRFKVKKLEAERRLGRVEQNLLRLSDIVEEVDSRLRSIRSQATRAQRYREHTKRLQELRTQVALVDWRQFATTLESLSLEIEGLTDRRNSISAKLENAETELLQQETETYRLEEKTRRAETQFAEIHRQIVTIESSDAHRRSRMKDLDEEVSRYQQQLAAMSLRVGGEQQRTEELEKLKAAAQREEEALQQAFLQEESAFKEATSELNRLIQTAESSRRKQMAAVKQTAELENKISVMRSQLSSTKAAEKRCKEQLTLQGEELAGLATALAESEVVLTTLTQEKDHCDSQHKTVRKELTEARRKLARAQKEQAELVGIKTGATQRAHVLEELENRLEGVGSGVRDLLMQSRTHSDGPFRDVRGIVADLLQVNVETAPMVEIALGEQTHSIVLASSGAILELLQQQPGALPGRVRFLRMDAELPALAIDRVDLTGLPGVVQRLDKLVESQPEFLPLVRRLLGRTWLVHDLATALELANGAGRGLDFVTRSGEKVTANGMLIAGPRQTNTGLISRRSELRALRQEISRLEREMQTGAASLSTLETEVETLEAEQTKLAAHLATLNGDLSRQRLETASLRDRNEQLSSQQERLEIERKAAAAQVSSSEIELQKAEEELQRANLKAKQLEETTQADAATLVRLHADKDRQQKQIMERQVALATGRQKREALQAQLAQLQRDQVEREAALTEVRKRWRTSRFQQRQIQKQLLSSVGKLAELYLDAEAHEREIAYCTSKRQTMRAARTDLQETVQINRRKLRDCEHSLQEKIIAADHQKTQQQALELRLSEDYGMQPEDFEKMAFANDSEAVEDQEREIASLRRKIANVGAVNLQAIEELDGLEERSTTLSTQYHDLSDAKESLEKIITRINADSRKMFAATLETVRGHFQEMFRKLFGGGQADIVLDDANAADILECGIEIVARPPGKDPRSISLLSGGEKTLTCVALLLSIFRSRPSPFCVLDEVDAALDEANIERFSKVLSEFLTSTQFIVITHSKKTMTHANTLYGITMQESGISKQVSVRFEDVSDDGTISKQAIERSTAAVSGDTKSNGNDDETQAA